MREDFHGTAIESQVQLSDSVLARLHLLVRTDPQDPHRADTTRIEERIAAAVRTWADGFKDALLARYEEATALRLFARYASHFPPAYQDDTSAQLAVADLDALEPLAAGTAALKMSLHRQAGQSASQMHFRLFRRDSPDSDLGRAADDGKPGAQGDQRAPVRSRSAGGRHVLDPGLRARAPRRHQHRSRCRGP